MNPVKSISSFFIFFGIAFSLSAHLRQDSLSINTVVERTQKLLEGYPIEKVHLHFDKPYYAIGDTLWFKAYLVSNLYNYDWSKVAYVEILNERDSLMQTLRIPLVNHAGAGHLVLDPQWYSQNNYRVRAYTKWMVNSDPAYFFNKIIPVGDVINSKLHTTITYNDVSKGEQARTQAVIQFTDNTGKVLGNRRVNWEAAAGYETIDRGRGETDVMGNIIININGKDRELLRSGNLHLSIMPDRGNDLLTGSFPLRESLWDADVQFFPEGGDLIAGVLKKVGFKAIGSNGEGLTNVKGSVVDQHNTEVASFEDIHLGMGHFSFVPVYGSTYKANITFENGIQRTFPLPEVAEKGLNLSLVSAAGDQLQLAIIANEAYFEANKNRGLYLIAQSNGVLCYGAQALLRNSSVLVNLPKERFPQGITQLTLFTADGTPVSERLVFVDAIAPLDISVSTSKKEYTTKELVDLDITTANNGSKTAGIYSISVTDESKVPYDENNEISILSNLLLTSDLKGYVEKPNYYFNEPDEHKKQALDVLLITQGYRRFSYEEVLAEKYPEIYFLPEQGIEISGMLRLNSGKPVANGGLLLSIPDMTFRKDTYTDESGRFVFKDLVFTDSSRVTINARGNDNYRNMIITVDQTHFPGIDKNVYLGNAELNIGKALAPYLDNSRNEYRTSILIEEVEVTATRKQGVSHKDYPSISGLGMADHSISADRLKGCNILLMCLQTALTGITYDSQNQLFFITRDYNAGGRIPVQFFVNGMPMDVPSLNSIMPSEVEGIEVFLRDELGIVSRTHQNNGVVSIYTRNEHKSAKRMSLSEIESLLPKSNVVDLTPLGYVKAREFYAPKYDTPERQAVHDIRTTIYWNPNVVTDEEGKASLHFFNADGRGSYRVVVEGMDEEGNIGRTVYRYTVK